jgi:competence ComEA-like helix-hairpin-helix protein
MSRRNFPKRRYAHYLFVCVYALLPARGVSLQSDQLHPLNGQAKIHTSDSLLSPSTAGPEKININQANVQELQSLPGIGPVTAKRIVDYRKKNPSFRSVDELLIIRGVSRSRLELIRSKICVN